MPTRPKASQSKPSDKKKPRKTAARGRRPKATGPAAETVSVEIDINGLEGWLWDAACSIRGAIDAPKFKDYILPLIFLKRLSDVFDDEIDRLAEKFGDRAIALELAA